MKKPPFNEFEDLKEFVSKSSLADFQLSLPLLSAENFGEAFYLLREEVKRSNRKQKIEALLAFLDEPEELKKVAKSLSEKNFLALLQVLKEHPEGHQRVSPLLISLPHKIFFHGIRHFEPSLIAFIKGQSFQETLQHHLNLYLADGYLLLEESFSKVEKLKERFAANASHPLTQKLFETYMKDISTLQANFQAALADLNQILGMTWHTLRGDLIEKMGDLDKKFHYFNHHSIGELLSDEGESTGLYREFQRAYGHVYENFSFSDETPSLEGLTSLSVLDIHDYIKCGLVPFFESAEKYEDYLKQANDKDKREYQNHILLYVQGLLNQHDLATVGDLKKAGIFSREILESYLAGLLLPLQRYE